jgi:hypothetical protein
LQQLKHPPSSKPTELGRQIEAIARQKRKEHRPIFSSFEGDSNVTVLRDRDEPKHPSPIISTPFGMEIDFNDRHRSTASRSNWVTIEGDWNVTISRALQSRKHPVLRDECVTFARNNSWLFLRNSESKLRASNVPDALLRQTGVNGSMLQLSPTPSMESGAGGKG